VNILCCSFHRSMAFVAAMVEASRICYRQLAHVVVQSMPKDAEVQKSRSNL